VSTSAHTQGSCKELWEKRALAFLRIIRNAGGAGGDLYRGSGTGHLRVGRSGTIGTRGQGMFIKRRVLLWKPSFSQCQLI